MDKVEIIIKCNEIQAEHILNHFKNEHDDEHRYAYLMFNDNESKPYILDINRIKKTIHIDID